MDMEQFRQFYQENFYYIIAVQIVVGSLLGAVPLVRGIRNDRKNLGFIGFVVTVVLATVSPIVALIVAVVFTLLVRRRDSQPERAGFSSDDNSTND